MIKLTENAVAKIREMAQAQDFGDQGVRIMIVGGGCGGFSYDMDFEKEAREGDEVTTQHDLQVYVDQMSICYLDEAVVDYVESLDFSGFHFDNPAAIPTCSGCSSAH